MDWAMLQSIHRQGYRAPDIRRVYIPKPGKTRKAPPRGADRLVTGLSSAARLRCCPPYMSRTSYPAHLAAGHGSAPIMPWQPSMRSLLAARSDGCWRRI